LRDAINAMAPGGVGGIGTVWACAAATPASKTTAHQSGLLRIRFLSFCRSAVVGGLNVFLTRKSAGG
jgi:hypothetical protein